MRKPPTGEPYAGDPHVRFGGEGAKSPLTLSVLGRSLPEGLDTVFVATVLMGEAHQEV